MRPPRVSWYGWPYDEGPLEAALRPNGFLQRQLPSSSTSVPVLSSPSHETGIRSTPPSSSVASRNLPPVGGSITRTSSRGQEPRSSGLIQTTVSVVPSPSLIGLSAKATTR